MFLQERKYMPSSVVPEKHGPVVGRCTKTLDRTQTMIVESYRFPSIRRKKNVGSTSRRSQFQKFIKRRPMLVCRRKRVVPARSVSKKNLDHIGSLKASELAAAPMLDRKTWAAQAYDSGKIWIGSSIDAWAGGKTLLWTRTGHRARALMLLIG